MANEKALMSFCRGMKMLVPESGKIGRYAVIKTEEQTGSFPLKNLVLAALVANKYKSAK